MTTDAQRLEFPAILQQLKDCAVSDAARQVLDTLEPSTGEAICRQRIAETTAARAVLDACGSPPLAMMKDLDETLSLSRIGAMLTPAQLTGVALFATACRRMAAYLLRSETQAAAVAAYGRELIPLDSLSSEIERCVDETAVHDEASPQLRNLRRKREVAETRIREKLTQLLHSRKAMLADGFVATRNGRFVLPVQRRYQSQFGGTVVDVSASGNTVFMEPDAVAGLQGELAALVVEEDAEVRRVLYTLTALVHTQEEPLRRNRDTMLALDVLFAKAKLSAAMRAVPADITGERSLCLHGARHPLLDPAACVPLDLELDVQTQGVIITGPNTGGKTVSLKTVGLLCLMAQCGLHIPCEPGTRLPLRDAFWCDIGDAQSMAQNLSTFSGHLTNIIRILQGVSRDGLVLLDELGSGTDPAEGMGIAIAVLEELRRRGCLYLVTTHYPQVKAYAADTEGVQTARMAFDPETLAPLYRLEQGKAGESCALQIAKRLGLAPALLQRARHEVYGGPDTAEAPFMSIPPSRAERIRPATVQQNLAGKFSLGDSVILLPGGETALVYRPADEQGNVVIQIKGEKRTINHTRLRLRIPASELYPPDYDFSIVFDSVSNRKASHILGKRHDPGIAVVHGSGEL